MATIDQRSGSWRTRWRQGGRGGRQQSTTWPDQRHAERAKRIAEAHGHGVTADEVYEAILGASDPVEQATPTLRAWSQTWLATLVGPSAGTRRDYERIVRLHMLPQLGRERLADIDADMVRAWAAAQSAQRAPATVRKSHAVLHQLLAAAVPRHLASNPTEHQGGRRGQRGLPKVQRSDMAVLEPAEARRLVDVAPPAIRDMIRVVLATGLRLGEVIALQCGDVTRRTRDDIEHTVIEVRRALAHDGTIGPPKSDAGRRSIVVTGEAAEVLARAVKGRSPRALVFTAPRGGRWSRDNFRNRYWHRAVASASRCPDHPPAPLDRKARTGPAPVDPLAVSTCDCPTRLHSAPRFHDLRHTHASMLIAAGWDPLAIKTRMGHSSITVTYDVYGHLFDHGQTARLAALDALLAP